MASAGAAGRWRILFWVVWSLANNQGLLPRNRENMAGGEAAGSLHGIWGHALGGCVILDT